MLLVKNIKQENFILPEGKFYIVELELDNKIKVSCDDFEKIFSIKVGDSVNIFDNINELELCDRNFVIY